MDTTEALLSAALAQQPPAPAPVAAPPPTPHPGWRANGTSVEWYDPTGNYPTPESWDAPRDASTQPTAAAPPDATMALLSSALDTPLPAHAGRTPPPQSPSQPKVVPWVIPGGWGFSQQVSSNLPLANTVAGLAGGTVDLGAQGVNAVSNALGYGRPLKTVGFSNAYHDASNDERQQAANYSAAHPIASKLATALSAVTSTGPGPVASSLLGRALQGAGGGAILGAGYGADDGQPDSIEQRALNIGTGALGGAALGGAVPIVAEKVIQPVTDLASSLIAPQATVARQAIRTIAQRMQQDQNAGGPSANDIQQALAGANGAPLTIRDFAGANTAALGGTLARTPGPASQTINDFLTSRDKGAGTRLSSIVNDALTPGNTASAYSTATDLGNVRQAAARPAYQAAGVPANAADFPNAPIVDTPAVNNLIANSRNIRGAINQARGNSAYAGLPNNNMVMLDQAYKNIGGAANAAKVAGNGPQAFALDNERGNLLDAITGGDPNHPYHAALAAYSGPSQSMDALNQGSQIFNKDPAEVSADISKLSPNDAEFYKLGAAGAIKTKIAKTGRGGDETRAVIGNQNVQDQLAPLFNSPKDFNSFLDSVTNEQRMFDTKYQDLGNSLTAARVAADNAGSGAGKHLFQAGASALAGEPVSAGMSLIRAMTAHGQKLNPTVAGHIASVLYNPDATASGNFLANVLATRPQGTTNPLWTNSAAKVGSQLAQALRLNPNAQPVQP